MLEQFYSLSVSKDLRRLFDSALGILLSRVQTLLALFLSSLDDSKAIRWDLSLSNLFCPSDRFFD